MFLEDKKIKETGKWNVTGKIKSLSAEEVRTLLMSVLTVTLTSQPL